MQAFGDWHSGYNDVPPKSQMELYLLKKQLRLEKKRLHKHAHITLPVIYAAKVCPNSAGAALRARLYQWRRQCLKGVKPLREPRCVNINKVVEETSGVNGEVVRHQVRCENICLPYSHHCVEHIGYNVDQKLFRYCAISVRVLGWLFEEKWGEGRVTNN